MKRILSILTLLFIINACDDGNLTVDAIDFSEGSVSKCTDNDLLYKVKNNEMFFIKIPDVTFTNEPTPDGQPIEIQITGDVKAVYRKYNGTVSLDNLCPTPTAATPSLMEEWDATSGTIQISISAIYGTPDPTTNLTKITGYKYYIVLKNTTFLKPDGTTQLYGDGNGLFVFGNYTVNISPLVLGFDAQVAKSTCTSDNRIFNFNSSEAMILDVADFATLFENAVTSTPRVVLIDANNKVTYKLFSGTINNDYFCGTTPPASPTLSQEWDAEDGVSGVSGTIEVSTTSLGPDFLHTIVFKNVTMKKGSSTFYLGDTYSFGSFVTTP